MSADGSTSKSSPSGNGNGRQKRKWYKDRTYLFMIGVFTIAAGLLVVQAEQQQFNKQQSETGIQLLVGQNKTLILVNETNAVVMSNGSIGHKVINPAVSTLEQVRNLLESVNNTLSNPNRTIQTEIKNNDQNRSS